MRKISKCHLVTLKTHPYNTTFQKTLKQILLCNWVPTTEYGVLITRWLFLSAAIAQSKLLLPNLYLTRILCMDLCVRYPAKKLNYSSHVPQGRNFRDARPAADGLKNKISGVERGPLKLLIGKLSTLGFSSLPAVT